MKKTQRIKTLEEAFAAFEARTNLERGLPPGNPNRVYRLDRMRVLCRAFGDPQDSFKAVHVAGSKGKGSVCAFAAGILGRSGFRTGMYLSPHLLDYRERFSIQGEPFPEEIACRTAADMLEALPGTEDGLPGEGRATTFELLTLFAFLLFRECKCQYAVLETGLGGLLDATNVVGQPAAILITPIEMEHAEILGPRLIDIADQKAGIFKRGCPVWSAGQRPRVAARLRSRADRLGCRFTHLKGLLRSVKAAGREMKSEIGGSLFRWELRWKGGRSEVMELAMGGRFQAENAALALAALRSILPAGSVDASALARVRLPGRFQVLQRNPLVVLDGAHTPMSVLGAAEAFAQAASGVSQSPPVLLFGCAADKDHLSMARGLCGGGSPLFREVVVSRPGTFKASDPAAAAASFRRTGAAVELAEDPREAWRIAREKAGPGGGILVTGSFYMACEIAGVWLSENKTDGLPGAAEFQSAASE